jgi:pimeloyl-ACP methyl ester carboxylesterase
MKLNDRFLHAADGTRIAYGVAGKGPALVLSNGLTTTSNFWARLWPTWIERHTVVTWDYPGHGASSPACTPQGASIEEQPRILARILDTLGIARATHVGFSLGCQVVFEMYRQFPQRCSALVALLGTAEHAISSTRMWVPAPVLLRLFKNTPSAMFEPGFRGLAQFANTEIGLKVGRGLGLVGSASAADMRGVLEHFSQLDPATMRTMALSAEEHSAFDVLSRLRVPLLVVAGDKDPFAPADRIGLPMHRAAHGSELVRLPEGTHTAMLDHAPQIAAAVERFLTGGAVIRA